ncbi:MAG: hypothetical protein ACYTGP_02635 [Planctomycetota bacterium]
MSRATRLLPALLVLALPTPLSGGGGEGGAREPLEVACLALPVREDLRLVLYKVSTSAAEVTAAIDLGCTVVEVSNGQLVQVGCDRPLKAAECGADLRDGLLRVHGPITLLTVTAVSKADDTEVCLADLCP